MNCTLPDNDYREVEALQWELQQAKCEIAILEALYFNHNKATEMGKDNADRAERFNLCDSINSPNSTPPRSKKECRVSQNLVHLKHSPIEIMPTEILGEIFLYFASFDHPFIICWVCRRWRTIGMDVVNLWTRPSFILGSVFFPTHPDADYTGAKEERYIKEMCRWLDRAHSSRSICLSLIRKSSDSHRWRELRILERIVRPHAGSFHSLELDVTQKQLDPLLNGLTKFHRLHSLCLHVPFLALDDWRWHQGLTGLAPLLQNVVISAEAVAQPAFDDCGFTACFPWSQLATLDMLRVTLNANMWHEILQQCTLLCDGSFTIHKPFSSSTYLTARPITASRLTSLRIRFEGEFHVRFFDVRVFHVMALPLLDTLSITARLESSDFGPFVAWMQQLSGQLRCLTLEIRIAEDTLFDILRGVGNLEQLGLYFHRNIVCQGKAFFRALRESCLPRLRVLTVFVVAEDPGTARITSRGLTSLQGTMVFDLVKIATTWAALGPRLDWRFQVFAHHGILCDVEARLLAVNTGLIVDIHSIPSLGFGRYHLDDLEGCLTALRIAT
ncbi:hypothetical protein B0H16DRAFT_1485752 [Mycena metata]|uniref:F-box domain-containing protein n=1 Tax=Mycena metata TaxID=1033252 RepID=A0AAD7DL42_9AGAR|nr:hypothetical protein B0H16DRAFT_1485752 [Mycena metata]